MKLYLANGCYYGTQADAKKADKAFEQVDVPTDKEGLINHLNGLLAIRGGIEDQFTDVVERADPSYSQRSVDIDAAFEALPVEHQLTLASLALENARDHIGTLSANQRGGIAEEPDAVDPFA